MAEHLLQDVNVYRGPYRKAYNEAMHSPLLGLLLERKALEVVRLYQARVGKKTGRLADSASSHPAAIGGHHNDRLIGKVTVADSTVVSEWKGQPFYYGEFHEEGTKKKGRKRRRKYGREGYHELRQVAHELRGSP